MPHRALVAATALFLSACAHTEHATPAGPRWLAGDHHVHTRYSVGWRYKGAPSSVEPPVAQIGGDAPYPIAEIAAHARAHGLDWLVTTDHGGPGHSVVNYELAYPEVRQVRAALPDLLVFYGMEFDAPGADHATLILPMTAREAETLRAIEGRYNKREPFPMTPEADSEPRMDAALAAMARLDPPPVVIVNHVSRSLEDGAYTKVRPAELRRWRDLAPDVVIGMEGAPGHQARAVRPDGRLEPTAPRGGYEDVPTHGGFDPIVAEVGGLWDAFLGEGRRWWITATSDFHRHWRHGGDEFWPGEYSKTYVFAEPRSEAILAALRAGRVFAVTGDLISALTLEARTGGARAGMGETLHVEAGSPVEITVAFTDPAGANAHGDRPAVARLDLIAGKIDPAAFTADADAHPGAHVAARFARTDLASADGERFQATFVFENVTESFYFRVRGTNTDEAEPQPDPLGEDPWSDLWFYSNPIFVEVRPRAGDVQSRGHEPGRP